MVPLFRFPNLYFHVVRRSLIVDIIYFNRDVVRAGFVKCIGHGFQIAFLAITKVPIDGIGLYAASNVRFKLKSCRCNVFRVA
jgi:hypothetical protein